MAQYWVDRIAKAQEKLTSKAISQTEKQLRKYYKRSMEKVISEFEATYNKLLAQQAEGKNVTPADLYKLDKYWQLQGQMRIELQKLGDKQASKLSKVFELHFFDIYYSINIEGKETFTTLDSAAARQMIEAIWCADGKSWSQRVWKNLEKLQETLNENLIYCVASGKKPSELKKLLQERFGVSYNRAAALVETEITHIQTQAAAKRYEDYGIEQYEFYADPDERTCEVCGALHGKKFYYSELQPGVNAPPLHPRDRCTIIPVV